MRRRSWVLALAAIVFMTFGLGSGARAATTTFSIASVSPTAVAQGQVRTFTVAGTGFVAPLSVSLDGPSGSPVVLKRVQVASTKITGSTLIPTDAATGDYDVTVHNGDARTTTCIDCVEVFAAPTIVAVSPSSVTRGTNNALTITGSGFSPAATVTSPTGTVFTGTKVNSAGTAITGVLHVSPTAAVGPGQTISVDNGAVAGHGTARDSSLTIAAQPSVTAISPSRVAVGTRVKPVRVTGSGFTAGDTLQSGIAGIAFADVTVASDSEIDADITVAPGLDPGPYDVSVVDGSSRLTCAGCLIVEPVVAISSVSGEGPSDSPDLAPDVPRTLVATGAGFIDATAVTLRGPSSTRLALTDIQTRSDSQVSAVATVPASAPVGSYDLRVLNRDGHSATCVGCVSVRPLPTITKISPSPVTTGQTYRLRITGANFTPDATVAGPGTFSDVAVNSSGTALTVTVAATGAPGAAQTVTVTNGSLGGFGSASSTLLDVQGPPQVSGISPGQVQQGATAAPVTISGYGFEPGSTVSTSDPDITFASVTVVDYKTITAQVSAGAEAALGSVDVSVSTGSGKLTCTRCLTVIRALTVSSVSPTHLVQGSQTLTINGAGFVVGATTSVRLTLAKPSYTIVSSRATVVSSTQLRAVVTDRRYDQSGAYDVEVSQPGATSSCAACVTIDNPPILDQSAQRVSPNATTTLTLRGSNLPLDAVVVDQPGYTFTATSTNEAQTEITTTVTVDSSAPECGSEIPVRYGPGASQLLGSFLLIPMAGTCT